MGYKQNTEINNYYKYRNDTKSNVKSIKINKLSLNLSSIEYLLSMWVLSFMLVEMRQFLKSENETTTFESIKNYFRDGWNYFDIIGCSLFLIGMVFRVLSILVKKDYLVIARFLFFIFLFNFYLN